MSTYSEDLKTKVIEMFNSGMTATAISKDMGCISSSSIYNILYRAGISPVDQYRLGARIRPDRKMTDIEERMFCDSYKEGGTIKEFAQKYNVSQRCLYKILIKHGVIRRRRGTIIRNFTKNELEDMGNMAKDGVSQAAIGRKYGVSQGIISRAFAFNGIATNKYVAKAENHGSWKGGKISAGNYNYVRIYSDSPFYAMRGTNGYVAEHRLVMAQHIGRCLSSDETVHHINSDSKDNRIENLQLRKGNHGKHSAYRCRCCGSVDIESYEIIS